MVREFLCFALSIYLGATGSTPAAARSERSIQELESRLQAINTELSGLARFTYSTGVGSVSYRSSVHPDADAEEWLKIDWKKDTLIDQIVLVPAIWLDSQKGPTADGFPTDFQILAGTSADPAGKVIASFTHADQLLPRTAPLVIPVKPLNASWIKLRCSRLSPRIWDGLYNLELAEIFVFSGEQNVALHQSVETMTSLPSDQTGRGKKYLVDGFIPYLMDSSGSKGSKAYVIKEVWSVDRPEVIIDLETSRTVNGIRWHAVETSDTFPQALPSNYYTPRHLLIEGSETPEFTDPVFMMEATFRDEYDTGPIIMASFPDKKARYIRLTMGETDATASLKHHGNIGFAEIEILDNGTNIARGKSIRTNIQAAPPDRSLASATDGKNVYGTILPLRTWMNQLALRHDLEYERPRIAAELTRKYAHQKHELRITIALASLLAAAIVITFLVARNTRIRQVARIKERFAADLHDEIGANLHAIGLLGDMGKNHPEATPRLNEIFDEIRSVSTETTAATRNCTSMLEVKGICEDLVSELKRTARNMLPSIQHEFNIVGQEKIESLRSAKRIDILLFYKESLANIIRHSNATKVVTDIFVNERKFILSIADNGTGLKGKMPSSLVRRSRLLGGKINIDSHPTHGTRVRLTVKN